MKNKSASPSSDLVELRDINGKSVIVHGSEISKFINSDFSLFGMSMDVLISVRKHLLQRGIPLPITVDGVNALLEAKEGKKSAPLCARCGDPIAQSVDMVHCLPCGIVLRRFKDVFELTKELKAAGWPKNRHLNVIGSDRGQANTETRS